MLLKNLKAYLAGPIRFELSPLVRELRPGTSIIRGHCMASQQHAYAQCYEFREKTSPILEPILKVLISINSTSWLIKFCKIRQIWQRLVPIFVLQTPPKYHFGSPVRSIARGSPNGRQEPLKSIINSLDHSAQSLS